MKKLIFICGPNGVGKSTTCQKLNERLQRSARVDSDWCRCMNPMDFSEELASVNERNIAALLANYLSCDFIRYVIFSYGLHGPRKRIWDRVLSHLSTFDYELIPIILTCEIDENVRRMRLDGRSDKRIENAIHHSRAIYDEMPYAKMDVTNLTADEAADAICELLKRSDPAREDSP